MAFDGYFVFDGSEIINVSRTEQYARNMGATWLRPQYNNDSLGFMVGDGLTYGTPLLDDAPWVDGDLPESLDFLGLYPLGIDGIESATRAAVVVESVGHGGVVRNVRHSTKSMVFSGVLCAVSEEGAEYGLRWLKQVLNGSPCGGGTNQVECSGADLCYLSAAPEMEIPTPMDGYTVTLTGEGTYGSGTYGDGGYGIGEGTGVLLTPPVPVPVFDPDPCITPYLRTLRNVTVTQGPAVTAKRLLSDGSAVWTVSFTAVAGTPYEFGPLVPIIEGFMDPSIDSPWVPGVTGGTHTVSPYVVADVQCPVPIYTPVYDPLCPAVIPPPRPASVSMGCFNQPASWSRRHITIPEQHIPLWGDVVPRIEVHARGPEIRALRIRFYADPYNLGNPDVDPCGYCGDILISYVPANSTLVFDAVDQEVYIQYQGMGRRRADSLVFKTDGTPFDWPVLSCGMAYIVTFDLPQTQAPPVVDLSLTARVV